MNIQSPFPAPPRPKNGHLGGRPPAAPPNPNAGKSPEAILESFQQRRAGVQEDMAKDLRVLGFAKSASNYGAIGFGLSLTALLGYTVLQGGPAPTALGVATVLTGATALIGTEIRNDRESNVQWGKQRDRVLGQQIALLQESIDQPQS